MSTIFLFVFTAIPSKFNVVLIYNLIYNNPIIL